MVDLIDMSPPEFEIRIPSLVSTAGTRIMIQTKPGDWDRYVRAIGLPRARCYFDGLNMLFNQLYSGALMVPDGAQATGRVLSPARLVATVSSYHSRSILEEHTGVVH